MRDRDDTPSAFHDVKDSVPPLPPPGGQARDSFIPVLPVSKSAIFWQKARLPVILFTSAIGLLVIGLFTREMLTSRDIDEAIAAAQGLEAVGTLESIRSARHRLAGLAERHPERPAAQEALAWQLVMEALLLGPEKELAKQAQSVIGVGNAEDTSSGMAAQSGLMLLVGKPQDALDMATQGLAVHTGEPRLELVRACALTELGKREAALKWIDESLGTTPRYAPLIHAGMKIAFEFGDIEKVLVLVERLASISGEEYLFGTLIAMTLSLPRWGDDAIDAEKKDSLLRRFKNLEARIESAPPKLAVIGSFLAGRVYLLADRIDEAVQALGQAAKLEPLAEYFNWYVYATRRQKGVAAALQLISSRPELETPELLDLRARCLLEYHRVESAGPVLDKLRVSGALPAKLAELRWIHAVRKGDLAESLAAMPETIRASNRLLALELFFQLKDAGMKEEIGKLTDAFGEDLKRCATVIENWQSRSTRRALRKISAESKDPCVAALAVKLLRGRVAPGKLEAAGEQAASVEGRDLRFEIDRARITWLVDGRAAAVKILDEIWQLGPEAVPLRQSLARAFVEMELPERALAVLDGLDGPEVLALRYSAARLMRGNDASGLLEEAQQTHSTSPHPASAYLVIRAQYLAGDYKDVSKQKSAVAPHAGHWTAEIADMVAKAINLVDDRSDADRLLVKTSERVGVYSGMDEVWEVRLARARLNMRRGGKFAKKASFWLGELKNKGLKDPRVFFGLAMARIRAGDEDAGVRLLKDAIEIDPSFKPAYTQLVKLDKLSDKESTQMEQVWPGWRP